MVKKRFCWGLGLRQILGPCSKVKTSPGLSSLNRGISPSIGPNSSRGGPPSPSPTQNQPIDAFDHFPIIILLVLSPVNEVLEKVLRDASPSTVIDSATLLWCHHRARVAIICIEGIFLRVLGFQLYRKWRRLQLCLWLTFSPVGPTLSLFSSLGDNSIIAARPLFVAAPLEDISVSGFFALFFQKLWQPIADLVNI